MASQKQQQHTILRLIRENEHLHKELLRAKERARLHGTKILHEALQIIDDNRMERSGRVISSKLVSCIFFMYHFNSYISYFYFVIALLTFEICNIQNY